MIIVPTCDRADGASYLEATLAAIDREIPREDEPLRLVLKDGGRLLEGERYELGWWQRASVAGKTRQGNLFSIHAGLQWAATFDEPLWWFEDDIQLTPGCWEQMQFAANVGCSWWSNPKPAAFITFLDVKEHTRSGPGLHYVPPHGFDGRDCWMSQAWYLPRSTIRRLVDLSWLADWCVTPKSRRSDDDGGRRHGSDVVVSYLLGEMGAGWYVHNPSLVQHVGEVSVCQPGTRRLSHKRVSPTFSKEPR